MIRKQEDGFSLIELLIVVVIVGIIATVAVPALQKGLRAAENGNAYATMHALSTAQMGYYQQNGRFGRIAEVNNVASQTFGTASGRSVIRGKFTLDSPGSPSDAELKVGYTLTATRNVAGEGIIYKYQLTQSGEILQILP